MLGIAEEPPQELNQIQQKQIVFRHQQAFLPNRV